MSIRIIPNRIETITAEGSEPQPVLILADDCRRVDVCASRCATVSAGIATRPIRFTDRMKRGFGRRFCPGWFWVEA